ncbi:MAG: UvrD-helicase domain-containing protein [Deltaproteobacteria bacterium]|nr:UvrD-helicase domain-containing protein [Deltaproteobacteria bacterium]MBW2067708.1 UvrD-helicase domain-containing protein [Deltaproteobacteria bacterium]
MNRGQGPELLRIKASAGAGKTYQLSVRYLNLLKKLGRPSPENLRRIVAITFTNKAAAEMKERILRFLKEIALGTETGQELSKKTGLSKENASKWIETIILHYSDFHVRTIDSLLFAILRALSFELGVKPEARVLFNAEPVLNEAFDMLLARSIRSDLSLLEEALDTYLTIDERGGFYPENGLRRRLFELYPKTKENLKRKSLDPVRLNQAEDEAKQAYFEFLDVVEKFKEHIKGNLIRGLKRDLDPMDLLERSIVNGDVQKIFKKNSRLSKEDRDYFCSKRQKLREKLETLLPLRQEKAYARVGGYVPALISLRQHVEEICRREGIILGSEHWTGIVLAEMRNDGVPPLIYAHFAARFLHFLFDEFQDTSRTQWDTLYPLFAEALSENGDLFVVGDVKQAIYRWRGGDWSLFDDIVSGKYFQSVENPTKKTLSGNFRSHPKLVKFFNALFEPLTDCKTILDDFSEIVLGKNSLPDVRKEFARSVSRAYSGHLQKPTAKRKFSEEDAIIRIYKVQADEREKIKDIVKKKFLEDVEQEWSKRKDMIGKSPVAVLVRSNSVGEEVSSWLIQKGIPVVTENALQLKACPVIKGILCFLYYLFEPQDLSAFYGFLASGLLNEGPSSEEELATAWIQGSTELWREHVESLTKKLRPFVNRWTPYELVQAVIEELGLYERLKNDLSAYAAFVYRLLEVTHQFVLEEGASLGKYLSFWERGGLEERVGLPENVCAVRVLTIHKAKGLEFPVVFIPFTDWTIRDMTPVDVHNGYLVHLQKPLSEELEKVRMRLMAEEAQELLNLFYVAVTRAEEALYLFLTPSRRRGFKDVSHWVEKLLERNNDSCHVQILTSE